MPISKKLAIWVALVSLAACKGDGSGSQTDAATGDALNTGDGSTADAAPPAFCVNKPSTAVFCEDFDDPSTYVIWNGWGTQGSADMTTFVSPPASALVTSVG